MRNKLIKLFKNCFYFSKYFISCVSYSTKKWLGGFSPPFFSRIYRHHIFRKFVVVLNNLVCFCCSFGHRWNTPKQFCYYSRYVSLLLGGGCTVHLSKCMTSWFVIYCVKILIDSAKSNQDIICVC